MKENTKICFTLFICPVRDNIVIEQINHQECKSRRDDIVYLLQIMLYPTKYIFRQMKDYIFQAADGILPGKSASYDAAPGYLYI